MARQLLLIMAESEEAAEVVKAHTLGTWVDVPAPSFDMDARDVWNRCLMPAYMALRYRLIGQTRANLTPEPQPAHTEPSE